MHGYMSREYITKGKNMIDCWFSSVSTTAWDFWLRTLCKLEVITLSPICFAQQDEPYQRAKSLSGVHLFIFSMI